MPVELTTAVAGWPDAATHLTRKTTMTLIKEVQIGTQTITGTDWPVVNQLHRDGRRWVAVVGLCNGTPVVSKTFSTKREALAYLG